MRLHNASYVNLIDFLWSITYYCLLTLMHSTETALLCTVILLSYRLTKKFTFLPAWSISRLRLSSWFGIHGTALNSRLGFHVCHLTHLAVFVLNTITISPAQIFVSVTSPRLSFRTSTLCRVYNPNQYCHDHHLHTDDTQLWQLLAYSPSIY